MQIIIIGCGKVGRNLARQLSEEDHNITVVDINPETIQRVTMAYDVMGITGNGASYTVLQEADIDNADILLAVTQSDEINLLCCFIAKNHKCRTIARVRNPVYSAERAKFKKEFGISMIINPERASAQVIRQILEFPAALEISNFGRVNTDLITFIVKKGSALIGRQLKSMTDLREEAALICVAEREKKVIIPNGDYRIEENDILTIIASSEKAVHIFKKLGVYESHVKNAMIIGGGQLAYYLTDMLTGSGIKVKIIERSRERAVELSDLLPHATIICGDGTSQELLNEEHLDQMEACVAATGLDEANIILSLYARRKVKSKVVTKMSHLDLNTVIDGLDLDSIIDTKDVTSMSILQYVRAMSNSIGSGVETLYKLREDKVEALEFIVKDDSELTNVALKDMELKENVLIAGISRNGKLIIPGGNDVFMKDDHVFIATTHKGFTDMKQILAGRALS